MSNKTFQEFKTQVLSLCKTQLLEKLTLLEKELKYLSHDIAADTKSSAGDKFETSREMANAEIDKLQGQVNSLNRAMTTLNTLPVSKGVKVALGSLVKTDTVWIFIAISLGAIKIDKKQVLVISAEAPLAQLLLGKAVNEKVVFNGRSYIVKGIY